MTFPLFESEALEASIRRLKAEQKAMRESKTKINKDLKNAEKRRSRLKKRARQLSDADLVAVLQMRASAPGSANASAVGGTAAVPLPAAAPPTEDEDDAHDP